MVTDSRTAHTTDQMNHRWTGRTRISILSLPPLVSPDTPTEFMSISLGSPVLDCFKLNILMEFFLLLGGGDVIGSHHITRLALNLCDPPSSTYQVLRF